jgi:hypothetical protein
LLYPVTAYTVVVNGASFIDMFVDPVLQLYDVAPPAVTLIFVPAQIKVLLALIFTVGLGAVNIT